MLSFKDLTEKKTKVKINPKMKDVMEVIDGAPITMHPYSKGGKVKKKKDLKEGGCQSKGVPSTANLPQMAKGGKLEVKKNHGEDCDCPKCEKKRRSEDVNDGPDVANEEIKMTPGVIGWNNDSTPSTTVYAKVVNLSGSGTTIDVELKVLQLEA